MSSGKRPAGGADAAGAKKAKLPPSNKKIAQALYKSVESSLKIYEPRVNVREVEVRPNFDQNEFNVTIIYEIIGADVPAQELQFVLQSTR